MFIINFFSLIIILIIHILLFNYTFVSSKRQKRVIDNNDIEFEFQDKNQLNEKIKELNENSKKVDGLEDEKPTDQELKKLKRDEEKMK